MIKLYVLDGRFYIADDEGGLWPLTSPYEVAKISDHP